MRDRRPAVPSIPLNFDDTISFDFAFAGFSHCVLNLRRQVKGRCTLRGRVA